MSTLLEVCFADNAFGQGMARSAPSFGEDPKRSPLSEWGAGLLKDHGFDKGRKMRKISVLIAVCLVLAFSVNVMAQRAHPNIMNDLDATRDALDASREAGELDVVVTRAEGIQRLLGEVIPIYERMNLQEGVTRATEAAELWGGVVAAARANNLDGLATAYDAARGTCGGCHRVLRENGPDGNPRIRTQ